MEVAKAIEVFYGVWILVLGISLLTAHQQWKKLISSWLQNPEQYFILAFVFMPIGLFTIMFHNIWSGLSIIVSVLGWIVTIKAITIFCFPTLIYKFIDTSLLKRKMFLAVAVIYLLIGLCILIAFI